ncbi:uncharacterized protein CDV56_105891 [Aspergillus thermomutatus]|uniref:DUF2293 domain-containing protein n=1 Tax=Aspergillus thermomutatus TaxID=41047 RepID=A0A397HYP9_ASPTH|nr:uncharacterized protein CDV56_105891 [Aspergillus thermomutatus]RHZ66203.1 hypothetical protein CDV56_105891 [Aspergillus thermomutatus]
MVRVFRRPASALARRVPSRATKRTLRKHKVILESITQEKKKLRSVISFEAKAPPGYTFIPAGNPQLTGACKELCRKDGLKVYAVTTTPHMHTHNLSQHVHRIGYHFPSAVVATVCMDLGLHLTATGNVMPVHSTAAASESRHANSEVSQITINTEARDVLRDLFPNIPDNDLNQIIKTAFQKGQRKVGTAVELPLARRAQLAVVAHIRHIYTDYDRLLKTTSFHEARSAVEEPTLAKLVEWRGDDENGKTVLEDVFREVIVISDDDDSDVEEGEVSRSVNRDHSVEIISSHPRAEELQTRPVNFAHPTVRESHLDISDDEPPPGFRFIPESPKRQRVDRRGFSRYHAWDRALNRYRNGTYQHRFYTDSTGQRGPLLTARQPVQESITLDPGPASHRTIRTLRHVSVGPHIASRENILDHERKRTLMPPLMENRVSLQETEAERSGLEDAQNTHPRPRLIPHEPSNPETPVHLQNQRSDATRLANRALVEQVSADQQRARLDQRLNSPNTPVFVGGPTEIQGRSRVPSGAMSRIPGLPYLGMQPSPQDHVLPSIETPPSPQQIRRPPSAHLDQLTRRISGGFTIRSVTPRRPAPQDSLPQGESDVTWIPASKRRRVANQDPATYIEPRSDVVPMLPMDTHAKQQVGLQSVGDTWFQSNPLTLQSAIQRDLKILLTMPHNQFQKSWLAKGNILTFKADQQPGSISRSTSWSITRSYILSTDLLSKFTVHRVPALLLPLQMRALMVSQSCLTRLQKLDVFMKIAESIKDKLEKRLICQIRRLLDIVIAPLILMGPPEEASMPMTSAVMCKQLVPWILFLEQLMNNFDTTQAGK